jgi:putative sigma-54 modulation protein
MSINITARHTAITPELRKYCERRVQSIEKILGYPVETNLILSVEKYRNKVEIRIRAKGGSLNATEETQDMLTSLGMAFDSIDKRVKKEKEKLRERKRRKNKEVMSYAPASEDVESGRRLIRGKNYSIKPMSIDEALLLFESSKEEVLVFRKYDSEKWAILYRRKDGNFGLIEPEE